MRLLTVLLVIAVAIFASAPASAEVVFFDDFEHGADWDLIGTPVVPVGSWSLNGGTTANSMMAYWTPTHGGLPDSNVFGGRKYGATIRGIPDCDAGVVTNVDAQFSAQSNALDLVRFEADIYGQDGNGSSGIACDLKIAMLSGSTEVNSVTLSGGSSIGSVLLGAVATNMTYALNEWHHVTMDYSPTTATFDLTIDNQTLTGLAMTTPSAVDGFRFVETSAGTDRWSCFDNVKVSVSPIPEPSTLMLLACGLFGLLAIVWKSHK